MEILEMGILEMGNSRNVIGDDGASPDELDRDIEFGRIYEYTAPGIISLGSSRNLICGFFSGYADFSTGYYY